MKYKKILIIQTAFLGDVLLTFPLIHHLKKNFQESEIHIVVRKELASVFEILPSIDKVIGLDKKRRKIKNTLNLIRILRNEDYDLLISPHRSARTSLISYFSAVPERISFDKSSFSFLYSKRIKYRNDFHEIQRNLSLVDEIIRVEDWRAKINLNLDKKTNHPLIQNWLENKEKIIAIAPGTMWETKRYPTEYFKSLIQLLIQEKLKIILIGGKEDAYLVNAFSVEKFRKDSLLNLMGVLSVTETISLLDECDLLICNDSAPTHMGCLTSCKVFTIYGSTIPQFGFYPFRDFDSVVQIENLYCKPCGIHGRKKCPEKHFKCMINLKPEDIFNKVMQMLNLPVIK